MKRIVFFLVLSVAAMSSHCLGAQQLSAEYTTEMQTDFHRVANWVNLLRADFTLAAGERFHFDLVTISIARTRDERLIDDWQTFSNIEEENLPLALAVYRHPQHERRLFRFACNIVVCQQFVQHISHDFRQCPDSQLSALIVRHTLAFETEHWQFQTTLNNGTRHNRLAGRQNIFRICPTSEKIFGITSLNWQNNGSNFNIGTTFLTASLPKWRKPRR